MGERDAMTLNAPSFRVSGNEPPYVPLLGLDDSTLVALVAGQLAAGCLANPTSRGPYGLDLHIFVDQAMDIVKRAGEVAAMRAG